MFGLPLIWSQQDPGDCYGWVAPKDCAALVAAAESIKLTLDDKTVQASPPDKWVDGGSLRDGTHHRVFCTFTLALPKGTSLLRVRYTGSYDQNYSERDQIEYRGLLYELASKDTWSGKVDDLRIEVEPGIWSGRIKAIAPLPNEGRLAWHHSNIAIDELLPLQLSVDTSGVLFQRYAMATNAPKTCPGGSPNHCAQTKNARASSHLPPQGPNSYAADNVLDGNPRTAWCEGKSGAGKGEWIEVSFSDPVPECHLHSFGLILSYAKSDQALRDNGRVTRFSFDKCRATQPKTFVAAPVSKADAATMRVDWSSIATTNQDYLFSKTPRCVRLTIVDTKPGRRFADTCVSEIVPIYDCH